MQAAAASLPPLYRPRQGRRLYRENQAGCQGFVFSNPLLYHAVLHRIPKLERYCGCPPSTSATCTAPCSRWRWSTPHWTLPGPHRPNPAQPKDEWHLPPKARPVIELSKPEKGGLSSQEEILTRYRQLCRRDDLKLIITQLFALEEPLARAGTPLRVAHPSQESIQRAALDVLSI